MRTFNVVFRHKFGACNVEVTYGNFTLMAENVDFQERYETAEYMKNFMRELKENKVNAEA